jgi:hypothetical protein
VAVRRRTYHEFELERDAEPLEKITPELVGAARAALVEALMTGVARHKDARHLRATLEHVGELWRRSGGTLAGVDGSVIRAALGRRLQDLTRFDDFLRADLALDVGDFVPAERRRALEALPSSITVVGETCRLDYEVEDGTARVRMRLKERIARTLLEHELPSLDRPLVFSVMRGRHGAIRAGSLEELRSALTAPTGPVQGRRGRGRKHRRRL